MIDDIIWALPVRCVLYCALGWNTNEDADVWYYRIQDSSLLRWFCVCHHRHRSCFVQPVALSLFHLSKFVVSGVGVYLYDIPQVTTFLSTLQHWSHQVSPLRPCPLPDMTFKTLTMVFLCCIFDFNPLHGWGTRVHKSKVETEGALLSSSKKKLPAATATINKNESSVK